MKHIISLGAGVQSSTMALMAAAGEITPMPDAAIFADTQAEPQSVYTWLDWLETQLPFPLVKVSAGNLADDAVKIRHRKRDGVSYIKIGVPTFQRDGDKIGTLWRTCTADYKITPIQTWLRQYKTAGVTLWMGISIDEAHRQKESLKPWIINHYPLIDQRLSRKDCLDWMESKRFPAPPRSACVFCPYHSDAEWLRLKKYQPQEFSRAVAFEKRIQEAQRQQELVKTIPFLHPTARPLDSIQFRHENQRNLFGNECEGMCGV